MTFYESKTGLQNSGWQTLSRPSICINILALLLNQVKWKKKEIRTISDFYIVYGDIVPNGKNKIFFFLMMRFILWSFES